MSATPMKAPLEPQSAAPALDLMQRGWLESLLIKTWQILDLHKIIMLMISNVCYCGSNRHDWQVHSNIRSREAFIWRRQHINHYTVFTQHKWVLGSCSECLVLLVHRRALFRGGESQQMCRVIMPSATKLSLNLSGVRLATLIEVCLKVLKDVLVWRLECRFVVLVVVFSKLWWSPTLFAFVAGCFMYWTWKIVLRQPLAIIEDYCRVKVTGYYIHA